MRIDARSGCSASAAPLRMKMHQRVAANIDLHGIGC
jgi:hypothetical protein